VRIYNLERYGKAEGGRGGEGKGFANGERKTEAEEKEGTSKVRIVLQAQARVRKCKFPQSLTR